MTTTVVRVGDPERERTAARLGQAFTQGYLSMPEYETRLGRAFEAQTVVALGDLVADEGDCCSHDHHQQRYAR